jgi:hypothetical protein
VIPMPPVTMYPPSEVGKESKPKAASLFVELESTRALMNVALDGVGGGGAGFAAAAVAPPTRPNPARAMAARVVRTDMGVSLSWRVKEYGARSGRYYYSS